MTAGNIVTTRRRGEAAVEESVEGGGGTRALFLVCSSESSGNYNNYGCCRSLSLTDERKARVLFSASLSFIADGVTLLLIIVLFLSSLFSVFILGHSFQYLPSLRSDEPIT